MLTEWIQNVVEKQKIPKVVMAGGEAMNVKAMGKIANSDSIKDFFVRGSAADESLAIGAGLALAAENNKNKLTLTNLYLGSEIQNDDENQAITLAKDSGYKVLDYDEGAIINTGPRENCCTLCGKDGVRTKSPRQSFNSSRSNHR